MITKISAAVGVAALSAFLNGLTPVSAAAEPAVRSAAVQHEAAPEAAAPEPMAPAEIATPPAAGEPGGTASPPVSAAAPAAPADPVVSLVRERLTGLAGEKRSAGVDSDDLAAATAFYAARTAPLFTQGGGLSERGIAAAAEIARADDWGLEAKAFELPSSLASPGTEALADAETKLALAVLKYARYARGGRLDPSAVSKRFDQKPPLLEPAAVMQGITEASAADAYLRGLHPKHPQFERLRQALVALRAKASDAASANAEKPAASERQLIVNMERWRWMPADLGPFYVWNSIPDQMTSVIDAGKVVLSERIVVGKVSSPTPIFSADMQFVIFHPSWGVPDGIKNYELAPRLRASGGGWFSTKPLASSVLRAHGLTAYRNGRPVDPDSIDWSSTDIRSYHFTQPAGARNVLGIVKFRFPNKHDVYMHDTTERNLFGGAVRAFSHGCMRVQNPMRLAEVLLARDRGWSPDEVKAAERRGEQVTLTTPIPVHITYFTATVDDAGKITTRSDIYGLDGRVASALGRKDEPDTTPVAQRSKDTGAQSASATDAQQRRQRIRKRLVKKQPDGFTPFASLFGN